MRGDSLKERILRVATIEEVVAAYVPLQRSGAGYVGLCPFHADKHPSLHVHPGKQFFKCFACGEGGDLFAFVQKIEGCSFTEAMGKLAKRYSIDSREWTVDNYAGKKKRTDGKGTDGKGTAGSPDKTANENSDDQLSVVNSQLSIRTIGAANRLFASLLQPYVPEDEALRETYRLFGVGIAPPEVPADYRKMRSRLIFPIRDEKGGLVAFAARRRTDGEEGAKYVNSPASPVYSKSRVLYALDRAGEFLLDHWTIRKPIGPCHYGIGTLFMQVEYPFRNYNLFEYVYVLSFYERARKDARFLEAFHELEKKTVDGQIVVERVVPKLAKLAFCKKGEPSELATRRFGEIQENLAADI